LPTVSAGMRRLCRWRFRHIETFGRSKAFLNVHELAQLAQTEATVDWALRELHWEEDKADDRDSFFPAEKTDPAAYFSPASYC
jgi:hypothetical protein